MNRFVCRLVYVSLYISLSALLGVFCITAPAFSHLGFWFYSLLVLYSEAHKKVSSFVISILQVL